MYRFNKNGFTMIELLATITIMAILMLVAIPAITSIIEDARISTFEKSVGGIARAAMMESESMNDGSGETFMYKYENEAWQGIDFEIDGEIPKYMEVEVNEKNEVRYAITNGKYCSVKNEFDGKMVTKRISSENNSKMVQEKYCILDAIIATTDECFEYTENNGEITITGYYKKEGDSLFGKACPKDVTIPNKINKKPVTMIGDKAFYNYKLDSLTIIPNSIKKIGGWAFRNTDLPSLVLPEGVESIGGESFADNNIKTLSLPSTLSSIGLHSFRNNLLPQESAYIYKRNSDGSIDYSTIIGYGGESKDIVIPSEKNGVTLTTIALHAFYYNKLTNIVIPNTVIKIEEYAFCRNSFENLVIPEGVEFIGIGALGSGIISNLVLPSTLTDIGHRAFWGNKLPQEQAYIYGRNSDGSIDYSTLIGYGGDLKDIVIPSEKNNIPLKKISKQPFYGYGLTSVVIPNTVTEIGEASFHNNKLTVLNLPSNINYIGNGAFSKNNLTELNFPSSITRIGRLAFSDNSLTSVTINNSPSNVSLYESAFGTFDTNNIIWNYET